MARTASKPLRSASRVRRAPSAAPTPPPPDTPVVMLVAGVYAVLVAILWGVSNVYSGFPYETTFPYNSETTSWLGGFFYRADPLRIFTNLFYHLSYLMGEGLGIGGSYVPFQVVYAILWWARGFLVFLLLRRFLPGALAMCYVAGALVLVHGSDGALMWVGQMNQVGFIFWMLLAFYLLLAAAETTRRERWPALALGACLAVGLSLWSYESQILLILAFPFALLLRRGIGRRRLATVAAMWYALPALYIAASAVRYARASGGSYQFTVLRRDWSAGALLRDWWFNVDASLAFWRWVRGEWKMPQGEAVLLSLAAASVFVAGGLALMPLARRAESRLLALSAPTWLAALGAGAALLGLSFPVYLVLDSATGLWRTQLLSGVGAGLVLAALAGLAAHPLARGREKATVFLIIGAAVVYFGSLSAFEKGAFHRFIWERHRMAIAGILRVAPSVKPGTVVAVLGVPKDADPFGDNMWLDVALRLVYPGIPVAGVYFHAGGTASPGDNLVGVGREWEWDGTGYPPILRRAAIARTLVIEYHNGGKATLSPTMPAFICRGRCDTESYNPASVITGPVSPRAVRRYRLDATDGAPRS